jgi:hypothetical protein
MKRKNTELGLIVVLILCGSVLAGAQSDQSQPAAAPPTVVFGQENSAPTVNENPPISAIDLPGLEPHAAPESFLAPGLHVSESADSNQTDRLGGSSVGFITRALGSLTLLKLWKNYGLALDYLGGMADYTRSQIGVAQIQQLDFDNRITWKRGQLGLRDEFSYLPEGTFGAGAYGGSTALASLGAGFLGAGGFGENSAFFGGTTFGLGTTPRLMNLGMADVIEDLNPKSAITAAAGYGLVHFMGNGPPEIGENVSFIGSREFSGQVAYDRILTPKDQIALSYGYQAFDFTVVGADFHDNVIQAMYGHRVSGRMDFLISAGPQFTHFNELENFFGIITVPVSVNRIGVAGRALLRYRFPKATVDASFVRYEMNGSGIFAGAESNIARLGYNRPLSRVWDMFTDAGWAKNSRLQVAGSTVNATAFQNYYGGLGLHRQIGRSLRAYVSYQFNELDFNTACPVPGTSPRTGCSNHAQRQIGTIGLDWTPRPIRLD